MKREFLVFVVTVAIWTTAGYTIGLTKGKGWRAAAIGHGCVLMCRK